MNIIGADECWEWRGAISRTGYGVTTIKRLPFYVHRVSYTLTFGPIPEATCVCHKCDFRKCGNPFHYFLGTEMDNIKDRDRKNRGNAPKGEKCHMAKLTEDLVREMRKRFDAGGISNAEIARQYGITASVGWHAIRRNNWKHVS